MLIFAFTRQKFKLTSFSALGDGRLSYQTKMEYNNYMNNSIQISVLNIKPYNCVDAIPSSTIELVIHGQLSCLQKSEIVYYRVRQVIRTNNCHRIPAEGSKVLLMLQGFRQ